MAQKKVTPPAQIYLTEHRIDPSAVALAVSRAETGEVSYDEAVDLAEYDRLSGGGGR